MLPKFYAALIYLAGCSIIDPLALSTSTAAGDLPEEPVTVEPRESNDRLVNRGNGLESDLNIENDETKKPQPQSSQSSVFVDKEKVQLEKFGTATRSDPIDKREPAVTYGAGTIWPVTTVTEIWVDNAGHTGDVPVLPSNDPSAAEQSSYWFKEVSGIMSFDPIPGYGTDTLSGMSESHHISTITVTYLEGKELPALTKRDAHSDVGSIASRPSARFFTTAVEVWVNDAGSVWPVPVLPSDDPSAAEESAVIFSKLSRHDAVGGSMILEGISESHHTVTKLETWGVRGIEKRTATAIERDAADDTANSKGMFAWYSSLLGLSKRAATTVVTQVVEENIIVVQNPAGQPLSTYTTEIPGPIIKPSSGSAAPCSTPSGPSSPTVAPEASS